VIRLTAAVAGMVLVIGSCGIPRDDHARAVGPDAVPLGLSDTTTTTTTTTTTIPSVSTTTPRSTTTIPTEAVRLYYVDGDNVNFVTLTLPSPVSDQNVLFELAHSDGLPHRGLRTSIPETLLRAIDVRGGAAVIDLVSATLQGVAGAEQRTMFAQVVLTFTARPGIGTVRFTSNSEPVSAVIEDGSLKEVVSRDDYPTGAKSEGVQ
jgi:spore germination protein GerM